MANMPELREMAGLVAALRAEWRETETVWRDSVAEEFRRRFWEDWEAALPDFLAAAEELARTLEDAADDLGT